MTLYESIKHYEEKAKELREQAGFDTDNERYRMSESEKAGCLERAEEHAQLVGWLKELKDLRIFAAFVAKSVCSDEFEEDSGFYAEVLCRKLTKLGYIELDGDTYKLKKLFQSDEGDQNE